MEITVSEFLSKDYKEYSFYTIENRAIPSVIDGFKPVQRKVIFVCNEIWKNGNEKELKVFQLSGAVANKAYYHHGDKSLSDAIINMAQSFKNSLPLLEEDGQYGSLRSPKPGAPRYIGTKLSKNFRLLYKDFDLITSKEEEGEIIEPEYYLPIIPTVLLNGSSGIAVGFSSNILNRHPKDLIDSCLTILQGKAVDKVKPYIKDFTGEFINYTIKFTREDLASYTNEKLMKLLKLEEYRTELFNTLDEKGKIKLFESDVDIINYFVNFRLSYYNKRKQFLLEKLKHELKMLMNRGKFIKAILDDKLDIKNKSKDVIIDSIIDMKLELIDDSYDYLLRMPLWSLTKELFEKLKLDFTAKKEEIVKLEKEEPKDWYIQDLKELKKKV